MYIHPTHALKHLHPYTEPQWAHTQRKKLRPIGGRRSKARFSVTMSALWQHITPYWSSFHPFCLSFISQEITFCYTNFSKRGEKSKEGKVLRWRVHPTLLSNDLITHLDRPSHQVQSRVPRGTHTGSFPRCLYNRLRGTAEDYAHTRRCLTVEEDTHTYTSRHIQY